MPSGKEFLDQQFLEMRARVLSLAEDLDRIERAPGGAALLEADPRIQQIRRAVRIVLDERANRAEHVQMLFSDQTPPPPKSK